MAGTSRRSYATLHKHRVASCAFRRASRHVCTSSRGQRAAASEWLSAWQGTRDFQLSVLVLDVGYTFDSRPQQSAATTCKIRDGKQLSEARSRGRHAQHATGFAACGYCSSKRVPRKGAFRRYQLRDKHSSSARDPSYQERHHNLSRVHGDTPASLVDQHSTRSLNLPLARACRVHGCSVEQSQW